MYRERIGEEKMNQPIINIERKFRPEIEGLRVVAALLVAVYHIWFHRVSGGVDVFFVISGFLITTSIISTINRTGEFRFWPYISKLMKRLLPSGFFILGVTLLLSIFWLPDSIFLKTIREIIASMFYYQNWQLAISSTDYLDASQMKSPVEHFWALSIQGQFYIIWFLFFSLVLFLIKRYKITSAKTLINSALCVLFLVSLAFSIYLTEKNQPFAYFITFTRVWEFALGGLLCVNLSSIKINKTLATIMGWFGLIGLVLTGIIFNVSEMFPGYIAAWPMACALFIVVSGTKETRFGVGCFLGSPAMVKLGGISFGIYLWHWVILEYYRYNVQETPGIVTGLLIIILSVLLSAWMTRFIEKPIRHSKNDKLSFKRIGVLGSANLLLICLLLGATYFEQYKIEQKLTDKNYPGAMAVSSHIDTPNEEAIPTYSEVFDDLPIAHLDGSNQGLKKSDLKIGEYGETENYDVTIAVIGSSHSEQWLGAVLEATKAHKYRVLNITRSGTRLSTGYEDEKLKKEWVNNVLDYLEDADIDLIISQATVAHSPTKEVHQEITDQLEHIKNDLDIDVLALRDNPRYEFNVLESLETKGLEETTRQMNEEKNRQNDEAYWEEFIEKENSIYKLDLTDYFKVNDQFLPVIGNIRIYRDSNHMTNTYSESFGPIFEEEIIDIIENQ